MITAALSPTKDSATISVTATVTTHELQQLIFQLTQLRSEMTPEVARDIRQAINTDAPITEIEKGESHFGISNSGEMRISVRHSGFGWISFLLPERGVADLADLICKKRPARGLTHH